MSVIYLPRRLATSAMFAALTIGPAFGADDTVSIPAATIKQMQAEQQSTEAMAAEMMKGQRDWRARAIQLDGMVTDAKAQLDKLTTDTRARFDVLEKQLAEAKKSCPAPADTPKP